MKRSAPMLVLLAATLAVPTTVLVMPAEAHAQKRPKLPKPERKQQTAFLKSQVSAAKATVARGKPVLKSAKADAASAAKREVAARRARLASQARYETALQEWRANPTPASKQRMDAAYVAYAPIKQAHEDALSAKRTADARVTRLSGLQTEALSRLSSATREARIGPNPGLRPRVAQWALVRSSISNPAVVPQPGVIYSRLPPAPLARTNIYSNAGLAVGGQQNFRLPPPPPQFRQYDVAPPLLEDGRQRPLPPRPLRQNIYESPDSPLN